MVVNGTSVGYLKVGYGCPQGVNILNKNMFKPNNMDFKRLVARPRGSAYKRLCRSVGWSVGLSVGLSLFSYPSQQGGSGITRYDRVATVMKFLEIF